MHSIAEISFCITGLILGLRLANERQGHFVMKSLIGRAQA